MLPQAKCSRMVLKLSLCSCKILASKGSGLTDSIHTIHSSCTQHEALNGAISSSDGVLTRIQVERTNVALLVVVGLTATLASLSQLNSSSTHESATRERNTNRQLFQLEIVQVHGRAVGIPAIDSCLCVWKPDSCCQAIIVSSRSLPSSHWKCQASKGSAKGKQGFAKG